MSNVQFKSLSLMLAALLSLALPLDAKAQTAHFSDAQSTLGGGFSGPQGVAVDASGNVYVADTGNSLIKEIPVGCVASNCVVTLGGSNSFRNPQGVAVDASGNVYVADLGDAAVKEILAVGGSIPSTNPTITTLGTGFTSPSGVAVDANGNVYVADWGNKAVYEILKAGGYATVNALGGGFSHPEGVAVDASGHVFVADGGSQAVGEIPVGCASSACVTQLAGYYFSFQPIGIAVDASGDIFVAGGGAQTKTVYEILAVSGSIPSANPTVVALGGGLSEPTGVAADSSGNVYVADYLNNRVEELETKGVNFGTVAIGQTTAAIPLTFTFDGAGAIGSPAALTQGATGLDFALASGGSCSAGTSFNVGDTCTLNVTFTPKYPGLRYGAAVLKDGSGNTIATAYVHGIGSGPQVGYQPGPLSVRSYPYIGILAERGIAVDSSGNVFIANYKNTDPNAVIDEISAGCATTACVKPLAGLFSIPWGVAVDGAGNVFVADESAGELSEIQASGGYATVKTLSGVYGNPISVAVDGSGNLFFADTGSGTAKEALASSGYATVRTLASGLYLPGGIAVDSSGNVFISDTGNHAVKEIEAVNGSVPASPVINSLGSGFQYPQGIAVDSSGNVFVLDSGTSAQAAYEILAAGGYTTVKTLSKGFDSPTGMALDQTGNLQIVDGEYLMTLDRSDAPSLSFATPTPPGLTDTADGPKTATIQNIGTMPLTFTGMSLSGANFKIDSGTTTCSASTVLAVGSSCTVGVVFAPVTTGTALTGTLTLTDNALNQPGATQQITFSGKGMLSPTVSVTPSSQSLTTAQGLTVTIAVSGGSGNPTPTGSVTLVDGGYNSGTTALSGGSATFDIPAGALAMGADSLTASYTPDSTSASVYTQALSSAISVNVTAMAAPTVTVEPSSLSITTAQALTVTVAVGGGSGNPAPTGTVTLTGGGYTSAAATLSGGSATFNLSAGALAVGADTLTASYTPDSVSLPIYSVSTGSSTVTVAFGAAPSGSGSFGTVAIGQSAAISLTFTFSSSATLASPVALTQGASGLDFAVAAGGTCATGASFSAGQTCQVNVTFKPKYAGIRYGAVVLEGSSGSPIAMAYLSGVGSGPQVSFLPYAQSTLGGSFGTPNTVAVDGSGNVYVADYTDEVKMIPPGCASASCVTTVGGGFNAAGGVAVDGAGNVFVADSLNSAVKEIPPGCVSAGCVQTLSTNFVFPEAVAVDGSGNLFVADLGPLSSGEADSAPNGSVKEILAAGGYTTVNTLSSGLNTISGVAVDAASNVFIAFGGNQSNSAVEEISAAGGYATAHILTIGLNGPGGVAVDGVGNLYVVDYGNLALKELPVTSNYSTVNTLVSFGLNATPNSVTVDASGNIYLAVPAASPAGGVFKLDYADAPALAFRTTTAGTTDTVDGTKTVTLENIGNSALQLSGLALPSTNFSTAVAATTCTSSATLAAGTSCAVGVQFAPAAAGSFTGTISWTDNALNIAGATQQVSLSGSGETDAAPPAPSITSQPPNPSGVATAAFSFSDAQAGVTFVCSLDGAASAACSSGVSYPSLANGSHSFAVMAADAQGNLSAAATYNWSITAVPVPSIFAGPANPTITAAAAFTFSDTQAGVTFVCSLDGAGYAACTSGVSYSSLAAGAHNFAVEAVNGSGTVSAPTTYPWTIVSALTLKAGSLQDFGTLPVGQASAAVSLTYTFTASVTLGAPVALTSGVPNLDFAITGGTCSAGSSFVAGNTCTITATFTPKFAGSRNGALLLKDSSGNTVVMGYLHGTGSGPQAIILSQSNYAPSSEVKLGGGFTHPFGVAVDGGGNVYVADYGNNAVKMIPLGCTSSSCVTALGGSFAGPYGVAVDGGGNVYVTELNGSDVKEIPFGCASASCVTTLGGGFFGPYGVAVDAGGNVFVADDGNNAVKEIPFGCASASCVKSLGSGFIAPLGVAVDGSGNVFVVEIGMVGSASTSGCDNAFCQTSTVALMEIPAAGGYSTVKTLENNLNAPIYLALDGSGNAYLTMFMSGYGEVQEWLAASGYKQMQSLNPSCGATTVSSCTRAGVAVDGSGNIYVVDTNTNSVLKMDYVDPPAAFSFATPTVAGTTDFADSYKMITLLNNGNAPLNLSAVTASTNFTALNGGSSTCTASSAVIPGSACYADVYLTPTTSGPLTGTLTLTDNNLNVAGATQVINFSGSGLPPAPTIVSGPPDSVSMTATTATFTFTDSEAGVIFLCSLDGAAFASCVSGVSYSGVIYGTHSFLVEAVDGLGNVSTATPYSWTIILFSGESTVPPSPVITSGPPSYTTGTTATFTFTDTQAGVTFLCSVNTYKSPTPCTSPMTYSSIATGANIFYVFAEDNLGSINETATMYSWIVGTAPPVPTPTGAFGSVAVGQTSAPLSLTVNFAGSGTLGSMAALTMGAPNLDFALPSGSTCAVGTKYSAGNTCTVSATFAPRAPGMRRGAIVLYDTSKPANVLATVYINGIGTGPAPVFEPGTITTIAGGGSGCAAQTDSVGDGCPATSAPVGTPHQIAVDGAGNVYVAEYMNARVQRIDAATGIITTVAGDGTAWYTGDGGPATKAELDTPLGVALDGAGNLYILDELWGRVRKVDASTGIISFVVGAGSATCTVPTNYFGDGCPATSSSVVLGDPWSIAVDGFGNIFIADPMYDNVREVYAATGIIVTVAGNEQTYSNAYGGEWGIGQFAGDGGPATSAALNEPFSVALDSAGNLFIGDNYNQRIRRVDASTGIITTVAGNGYSGGNEEGAYAGDGGAATSAELNMFQAGGLAVDAADNLYISDSNNYRVRKVNAATGIITTVVGSGNNSATWVYPNWVVNTSIGDGGPATDASLWPYSIALDGAGNLYISDQGSSKIRKVTVSTGPSLTFPSTVTGSTSAAQDVVVDNIGNAPLDVASVAPTANFTLGEGDTTCAAGGQSLAPAASCILGIEFAPQATGALTGKVTLTDNALNATAATQNIQLSGTGTGASSLIPTTTALAASAATATTGSSVTFTATVTPNSGTVTPTGSVTFMDGGTTLGAGTLNSSGVATLATTALALGTHSIAAIYGGDSKNSASTSAALPFTVSASVVSIATTLKASATSIGAGASVTFTATVTPASGTGTPSGTVTFTDGETTIGTAKLATGVATLTTTSLAVGTHSIAAAYGGDSGNSASASAPLSVTVSIVVTSTRLSASASTVPTGTSVTFTARVLPASGSGIPTGAITFTSGTATLGTGTLNAGGSATLATNSLAAGNHIILASYNGDINNSSSISGLVAVTVTAVATTPTVTVTPNPASITTAQVLTVTITISGGGDSPAPTGSVTLTSGSYLSSATLSGGSASFNIPGGSLAVGTDTLSVSYTPDSASSSSYNSATGSNTVSVTTPALTAQTIAFANPGAQTVGTPLTLTATATSGLAVSFASTTASVCTVAGATATFVTVGTCTIDATQAGNSTYAAAAMVAQSFAVNAAPLTAQTINFANPGAQTVGTPLTLTAAATSGLAVSFASTTASVCTVEGTQATFLTAGACTIDATQAGNSTYAAAAMAAQSFTVNAAPLTTQTIAFANPGAQTVGTPLTLTARATSGLAVGFASTTASVCTVSGTQAAFLAPGTCTIDANQAGNSTYAAAATVAQSFTVNAAPPPPNFTVASPTGAQTVQPGSAATYAINITPVNGSFTGVVTLSASGLPAGATATFVPSTVTPGSAGATSQLTIQTAATKGEAAPISPWPLAAPALALIGIFFVPGKRRRRWITFGVLLVATLGAAAALSGCGGGFGLAKVIQPQSYAVTVTGTSGADIQTTTVQLTVE